MRFWGKVAYDNYRLIKAGGTLGIAVAAKVLKSEDSKESKAKKGEESDTANQEKAKINKRPSEFRKKTVEKNWDDAKDGSKPDTKKCPDCDKDVEGNPHKKEKRNGDNGWDVDHQPKIKDRAPKETRKEVLDDYNEGTRLRCKSCNRSGGNNDSRFKK